MSNYESTNIELKISLLCEWALTKLCKSSQNWIGTKHQSNVMYLIFVFLLKMPLEV